MPAFRLKFPNSPQLARRACIDIQDCDSCRRGFESHQPPQRIPKRFNRLQNGTVFLHSAVFVCVPAKIPILGIDLLPFRIRQTMYAVHLYSIRCLAWGCFRPTTNCVTAADASIGATTLRADRTLYACARTAGGSKPTPSRAASIGCARSASMTKRCPGGR